MLKITMELILIIIGTGCAILAIHKEATRLDDDNIQWNITGYKNY